MGTIRTKKVPGRPGHYDVTNGVWTVEIFWDPTIRSASRKMGSWICIKKWMAPRVNANPHRIDTKDRAVEFATGLIREKTGVNYEAPVKKAPPTLSYAQAGLFTAREEGTRKFCGPTAIAAMTGISISEIERAVLKHRALHRPIVRERKGRGVVVKAMWITEIEPVLAILGWKVTEKKSYGLELKTFGQWLQNKPRGKWLVHVNGHFVAVSDTSFVDTKYREPIPLSRAPGKRKRIFGAYQIERVAA